MISIRNGLFETNSSSVHALVIPKSSNVHIPDHVKLRGGEYGWDTSTDYDTLNYFYQACKDAGPKELDKFKAYLTRKGIEFEETVYDENNDWNYVDHANELPFDDLFKNESMLDRFLFSNESFVDTGNDNDEDNCPDEYSYNSDYDVIMKYN